MDLGLRGARVLVTAASQGLGAAAARRFSLEGAEIVICSRNLEQLQATAAEINAESGNPVYTHAVDVTDAAAVDRLVKNSVDMMGGLDALVTNAGGPPAGRFDALDQKTWEQATQLTLLSAVTLIRASLPHLRQSTQAAILAVTSISAKQPIDNLLLSNVLRPAVVGLTKSLSQELGPEGIRVNSIMPGWTATERVAQIMETRATQNGTTVEEEYAKVGQGAALKRTGSPEEFANAAVFLCSPAAGFITGVAMPVDGGAILATL
jgi:3-oxoacyl-[acyl-carrier protein] reductase